jgi:hypothetical protein
MGTGMGKLAQGWRLLWLGAINTGHQYQPVIWE